MPERMLYSGNGDLANQFTGEGYHPLCQYDQSVRGQTRSLMVADAAVFQYFSPFLLDELRMLGYSKKR
jgi:hypothetical protein